MTHPSDKRERAGQPTFGNVLRGARLGFHWSGPHGAFIRIRDCGPDRFTVEAVTPDVIASMGGRKQKRVEFRCWWERDAYEPEFSVVDNCGPLVDLRESGGLFESEQRTWTIDFNGLDVTEATP